MDHEWNKHWPLRVSTLPSSPVDIMALEVCRSVLSSRSHVEKIHSSMPVHISREKKILCLRQRAFGTLVVQIIISVSLTLQSRPYSCQSKCMGTFHVSRIYSIVVHCICRMTEGLDVGLFVSHYFSPPSSQSKKFLW